MQAIVLGELGMTTERWGGGRAEQAVELWPPPYCGAAMPAYGCCANTLHPLVLGPAPPFARRPPRAQHIRGLAVDAVRGVHAQGALRHLVHSRRAHPGVELGHRGGHVLPDYQMDGNRIARRIAGLEDPIDFGESQLAIRGY